MTAGESRRRGGRAALGLAIAVVLAVGGGVLAGPARAIGGPTTASIDISPNPASAGAPVTLKVTVHGTLLSPLGIVQFFDGTSLFGPPLVLSPDFDDIEYVCSGCVPTDHSSATLTRSFSTGLHVLTVVYSGDGADLGSLGGPTTLTVNAASSSTSVLSSADPSVHGQPVTFTATVASTGDAPSGTVQFQVDGSDYGAAQPLDAAGHASITASDLDVGSHAVSAIFSSDNPDVLGSSGDLVLGFIHLPQDVTAADTTTAVGSSSNPSEFGGAVTFTATESVVAPGGGSPTGTVQFEDDGSALGAPVAVDGSGHATLTTSGIAVGTHTISAVYSSDSANFNGSSGDLSQTVGRARTTLVYFGATTADFHDSATLAAQLVRTDSGAPISGQTIGFTMASESCSATTDANGDSLCSITPADVADTYTVAAGFAGDTDYQPSSSSEPFVVTREETTTAYTGPTVILAGQPVLLSGRLLEDGSTPIAGRTLTLTLGAGAAAESCVTGATDASGDAECTVAAAVALGPQPLRAEFAGDAYYLPSTDASRTAIVFAFPARGAFVLGDRTAAAAGPAAVTFWGARWSSLNVLTGGDAPASFKGFADSTSATPPACGGTWTTRPGNSSSPVATLPSYMGTLVSTSIGKSGSTISGDIAGIVVVATAAGYAADPGHPGSGTILATYC